MKKQYCLTCGNHYLKMWGEKNLDYAHQSYFIKPASKFWKRYFNKKVRKGEQYKKGNWWDWS